MWVWWTIFKKSKYLENNKKHALVVTKCLVCLKVYVHYT